ANGRLQKRLEFSEDDSATLTLFDSKGRKLARFEAPVSPFIEFPSYLRPEPDRTADYASWNFDIKNSSQNIENFNHALRLKVADPAVKASYLIYANSESSSVPVLGCRDLKVL